MEDLDRCPRLEVLCRKASHLGGDYESQIPKERLRLTVACIANTEWAGYTLIDRWPEIIEFNLESQGLPGFFNFNQY